MTKWKSSQPRCVVQVIPVDVKRRVLMLHRSNTVRSARNVWSFPSGLHDIGESIQECAKRELAEEFGVEVLQTQTIDVYENIAGDADAQEQEHWVIVLVAALVKDVDAIVNNEPDKHDQTKVLDLLTEVDGSLHVKYPFHTSFARWWQANWNKAVLNLQIISMH